MYEVLTYEQIFGQYIKEYAEEYGTEKTSAIGKKIFTSDKINSIIAQSKSKRIPLTTIDILETLNSIGYFLFSKPRTQALGALFVLARWDSEVNSKEGFYSAVNLKQIAVDILKQSHVALSGPVPTTTGPNTELHFTQQMKNELQEVYNYSKTINYLNEADICMVCGNYEQEIEWYQRIIDLGSTSKEMLFELKFRMANVYYKQNKYDKFESFCKQILDDITLYNYDTIPSLSILKEVIINYINSYFDDDSFEAVQVLIKSFKILSRLPDGRDLFEFLEVYLKHLEFINKRVLYLHNYSWLAMPIEERTTLQAQYLDFTFDKNKEDLIQKLTAEKNYLIAKANLDADTRKNTRKPLGGDYDEILKKNENNNEK